MTRTLLNYAVRAPTRRINAPIHTVITTSIARTINKVSPHSFTQCGSHDHFVPPHVHIFNDEEASRKITP